MIDMNIILKRGAVCGLGGCAAPSWAIVASRRACHPGQPLRMGRSSKGIRCPSWSW
jgi:hypothetical protein